MREQDVDSEDYFINHNRLKAMTNHSPQLQLLLQKQKLVMRYLAEKNQIEFQVLLDVKLIWEVMDMDIFITYIEADSKEMLSHPISGDIFASFSVN